jgi:3-oxoacyl-[acyl-carrier protein] reductase
MDTGLSKRIALVNGASKGIGKAIAMGLSKEGASVCLVARNEIMLAAAAAEITEATGGEVMFMVADVAEPDAAKGCVDFVRKTFGRVDILINNAGGPAFGTLMSISETDWDNALQLSLRSAIRFTKEVIPGMLEHQWGRIVNVSSTVAKEPGPSMILSATARAGLAAFSKAVSTEYAAAGITVNTVCPGGVLTDRLKSLLEARSKAEGKPYDELLEQSQKSIPIGRFASPEEFAETVVFLCSEPARYVTGTYLSVDGGLTKGM